MINKIRPAVDIEFSDLTYNVGSCKIIKGIDGQFRSGQLTAIMGPSGAGKSTLMNILVGYVTAGVGGCIKINGEPRKLSVFNKLSSYIMQEDLLQPFLTVRECLLIAAELKLGSNCPDKTKAVVGILETLGLTKCADNFTNKISGGQRKRVSMALELVSNPTVVFLDEPTTGLDVVSVNQTVKLLKMLARQGLTVVCTVHQPSASLFDQFDRVYMLANGKCIYQGEPNQLVPFLSESVGYDCPQTYNPADFIFEILKPEVVNSLSDDIQNGKLLKLSTQDDGTTIDNYKHPEPLFTKSIKKNLQFPNSFWKQFCIIFGRMLLQKRRHVGGLWLQIIHHIFSGVIIGLIFLKVGNDASRPFDNFKFMLCVSVFFMYTHCMTPILTYPAEIKIMKREFFNRWYSLKAYYLAKTCSTLPLVVTLGLVFIVIVYVMSDQPRELKRFSWFTINCILIGLTAEGLGILIGFTFKCTNGTVVGPSTMAPILMLAMHGMGYGLQVHPFMSYVMKISFVRFGIVGIITALYLDNRVLECHEVDIPYCHYADGRMLVRDLAMKDEDPVTQLCGILFYFLFFRILAFLSLRYRCTTEFSNKLLIYITKIVNRK